MREYYTVIFSYRDAIFQCNSLCNSQLAKYHAKFPVLLTKGVNYHYMQKLAHHLQKISMNLSIKAHNLG